MSRHETVGTDTFLTLDRIAPFFFIIGSFVGIWHALPMLSVILDEQYFVGSVLRAIDMASVLPPVNEVPYGTVTFYLNYLLQIPYLLVLFAWKGFSIVSLKTYLILHPEISYLVPRLLNAVIATIVAITYDRFLRSEELPLAHRFAVLSVIFCTVISTATLHTGKMWVLSTVLAAASALCTYVALKNYLRGKTETMYGAVFWGIIFAFASLANFPLAGIFLINIPVLLYVFRNDTHRFHVAVRAVFVGIAVLIAVLATNLQSIYLLVVHTLKDIFPTLNGGALVQVGPSFSTSSLLHLEQLLVTFPLVIAVVAIAFGFRAIQNKLLFRLSMGYAGLYFLTIVVIVTWLSDVGRMLHYLFPLAFFFSGALASIAYEKMRYVIWGFVGLQTFVFIYVLYLLSVSTTFNQAAIYIEQNLKHENVLILNDVVELSLPLNKESALLQRDQLCGSKCMYWRLAIQESDFVPVVVTAQSNIGKVNPSSYNRAYMVKDQRSPESCALGPIKTFQSGSSEKDYVDVERNLGHYFLSDFWHLSRLGKNLMLYEVSDQCAVSVLAALDGGRGTASSF